MSSSRTPLVRRASQGLGGSLSELIGEYELHARRTRDVLEETLVRQRLYLHRFALALGVPGRGSLLGRLSAARLCGFLSAYARNYGPGSRKWLQFSLRSFLRFCHLRGYIDCDLAVLVPAYRARALATIPRAMDEDSVRQLLDSLGELTPEDIRDTAILRLLVTYGVRGVHIRRLRLDHIDWSARRLRFAAVKGGKAIEQYLTAPVGNSLLRYLRDGRPKAPYPEVFLTVRPPCRPLRTSAELSHLIAARLKRTGIRVPAGVSHGSHAFRHAFAGRLVGKIPFSHLADMLGHRDPASTLIYSKINFQELRQAALPWPEESV